MCKFVISGYTLHRQDFDFNVMLAGIDHLNHLPVIKFMQGFHIFHVDFYNISKWVQHNFFGIEFTGFIWLREYTGSYSVVL